MSDMSDESDESDPTRSNLQPRAGFSRWTRAYFPPPLISPFFSR